MSTVFGIWSGRSLPTFRRNVLPPSSESECKESKEPAKINLEAELNFNGYLLGDGEPG
jgi:hypothetical protein